MDDDRTLDDDAMRRLTAAILARAVQDADGGDAEARTWLILHGLDLADAMLDIAPRRVLAWATGRRKKRDHTRLL